MNKEVKWFFNNNNSTFKWPTFSFVHTSERTPLEIHLIYLGNKEIYCIIKTRCIFFVLVTTRCHLFHDCIFFCSNNTFFKKKNYAL